MNGDRGSGGADHHGGSRSAGLPLAMAMYDGTVGPHPARTVGNRSDGGKPSIQCDAGPHPTRAVGNRSDSGKPRTTSRSKRKDERVHSFFVRRDRAKPEGQQADGGANFLTAGGKAEGKSQREGGGARARCHRGPPTHQLFNISIVTPTRLGGGQGQGGVIAEAGGKLCEIREAIPGGDDIVEIPLQVTPDASSAEGTGRACTPPPASSPSGVADALAGLQLVGDAEDGDKGGDGDDDHDAARTVVRGSPKLDVRAVIIALGCCCCD